MDHTDPVLEHAIQTAHSFISGFEHWEQHGGSCILIYGDYGSGKSTLAGAIAHELIAQRQKSVIFQQWASIIDRLFFAVIEDQEERNRYRRALEEVDLLIIDEIGANKTRIVESQSSFLGHLLRRRHNLSKSVILITNHSPASLHQAVGDFCFEAIKAFNPVDIHLTGPSRRPPVVIMAADAIAALGKSDRLPPSFTARRWYPALLSNGFISGMLYSANRIPVTGRFFDRIIATEQSLEAFHGCQPLHGFGFAPALLNGAAFWHHPPVYPVPAFAATCRSAAASIKPRFTPCPASG